MRRISMCSVFLVLLVFFSSACVDGSRKAITGPEPSIPQANEETVTRIIIGSAEHPDPILAEVIELEKKGILRDVIVMESFPVQIKVTGPRDVIERLEKLPRKKLSAPK